jgi:hypothetical protein
MEQQTVPNEVYLSVLNLTREEFRDMLDCLTYALDKAAAERDDSMHRRVTAFMAKLVTDIERALHSPL